MARTMSTSTFTVSVPSIAGKVTTGPQFDLWARFGLMLKVWKERNDLARLDAHALADLGLTRSEVANEIARSPLDMPEHRY